MKEYDVNRITWTVAALKEAQALVAQLRADVAKAEAQIRASKNAVRLAHKEMEAKQRALDKKIGDSKFSGNRDQLEKQRQQLLTDFTEKDKSSEKQSELQREINGLTGKLKLALILAESLPGFLDEMARNDPKANLLIQELRSKVPAKNATETDVIK